MAKVEGGGGSRSAGSDLTAGRAAGGGRTIGIIAAVSGTCARLSPPVLRYHWRAVGGAVSASCANPRATGAVSAALDRASLF